MTVDAQAFVTALRWVLPAVARADARPVLQHVLLEPLRMVASDNYRIHVAPIALDTDRPWLVPLTEARRLVRSLQHLRGPLAMGEDQFRLYVDGQGVATADDVAAGMFRAIDRVVADARRGASRHCSVDAVALRHALRGWREPVKFIPVGRTSVRLVNGQASVLMRRMGGWPNPTALRADYLRAALPTRGTAELGVGTPLLPVTVTLADGRNATLMPVRTSPALGKPRTPRRPKRLFKWLDPDGSAIHGGSGTWPLPTTEGPGEWLRVEGVLVACHNGLHVVAADQVHTWRRNGAVLFEAEVRGEVQYAEQKWVAREARLVRQVPWDRRRLMRLALQQERHRLEDMDDSALLGTLPPKDAARALGIGRAK